MAGPVAAVANRARLPDVHPAGGDAFDPSGDLWVANAATLVEFNRQELAKVIDGARTPDDHSGAGATIWPGRSGSALGLFPGNG